MSGLHCCNTVCRFFIDAVYYCRCVMLIVDELYMGEVG
jgi:hypothetical protein